jgi:O-antigen chain-terminating methyltransferase
MPPERGPGPDIDRLVERIREEAAARFPEDVHEEETSWHPPAAGGGRGGGDGARPSWRARLKRHPVVGRVGRLVKGLILAGRTRVQAVEADQAAQAALRDIAQIKPKVADIQPLSDRLAGTERHLEDLETRQDTIQATLRAEVDDRVREAEQRIAGAEARVSAAESRVSEAETRVSQAEERAARAERGLRVARADLRAREASLDRVHAVLEGRSDVQTTPPAPDDPGVSNAEMEAFFTAFDAGLRGTAEAITAQVSGYLPDLHAAGAGAEDRPVLDLGCGRGTWLRVMRDDGIVCRGIDLNRTLIDEARANGLDARVADALAALREAADGSLGAITAFHLAEHLPFETLYAVFAEARRALAPGGLLLMETPNPENGYVGTHTFYHDPTHGNPLTPALMEFVASYHAFAEVEIRRLHPYPQDARLPDGAPANDRLNGWLCGPQDFALIARTASEPAG